MYGLSYIKKLNILFLTSLLLQANCISAMETVVWEAATEIATEIATETANAWPDHFSEPYFNEQQQLEPDLHCGLQSKKICQEVVG